MRKEEAIGIHSKWVPSTPKPKAVGAWTWTLVCWVHMLSPPFYFQLRAEPGKGDKATLPLGRWVGRAPSHGVLMNLAEPGLVGRDGPSLGSHFSPEGCLSCLYFIFVASIMLLCCQYDYRWQAISNNTSIFSFRTSVFIHTLLP